MEFEFLETVQNLVERDSSYCTVWQFLHAPSNTLRWYTCQNYGLGEMFRRGKEWLEPRLVYDRGAWLRVVHPLEI